MLNLSKIGRSIKAVSLACLFLFVASCNNAEIEKTFEKNEQTKPPSNKVKQGQKRPNYVVTIKKGDGRILAHLEHIPPANFRYKKYLIPVTEFSEEELYIEETNFKSTLAATFLNNKWFESEMKIEELPTLDPLIGELRRLKSSSESMKRHKNPSLLAGIEMLSVEKAVCKDGSSCRRYNFQQINNQEQDFFTFLVNKEETRVYEYETAKISPNTNGERRVQKVISIEYDIGLPSIEIPFMFMASANELEVEREKYLREIHSNR